MAGTAFPLRFSFRPATISPVRSRYQALTRAQHGSRHMPKPRTSLWIALASRAATCALSGAAAQSTPPAATAKPLLTQALPDVSGKEVLMLTVEYPAGGVSPAHRHNANTFVYVLEGSIVMA